jgi:hypothetical protein
MEELRALLTACPLPRTSLAIFNKRLSKRNAKRAAIAVHAPRPLPIYKRRPSGFEWTRAPRPPTLPPTPAGLPSLLPTPSPLPLAPPLSPAFAPAMGSFAPLPLLTEDGGALGHMMPPGVPNGAGNHHQQQQQQQRQQQQQAVVTPGGSMLGCWPVESAGSPPILDDDVLLALFFE